MQQLQTEQTLHDTDFDIFWLILNTLFTYLCIYKFFNYPIPILLFRWHKKSYKR